MIPPDVLVVGTLAPDATGDYREGAPVLGRPAWYQDGGPYGINEPWVGVYWLCLVTEFGGDPVSPSWDRAFGGFEGEYAPRHGATGIAGVTLVV